MIYHVSEESAVPQVSYSTKGEADHSETERYNRLSFAVRDPRGRIVSGDGAIVSMRFLIQVRVSCNFLT